MDRSPADLARRFDRLYRGGLRASLRKMAIGVALRAEGNAKLRATQRMKVRSGRLRNSISGSTLDTVNGLEVRLSAGGRSGGRDVRYAGIQEHGGTITPVKGRFLTYPVHPSLFTAAGVLRFPSARMVPNLRYDGTGKKPVLRSTITGEVFYVLLRQIKISPKRYLRDGLQEAAKNLPIDFDRAVKEALYG